MTWYELLKALHILAAASWFGSSLAITVIGFRALRGDGTSFGAFLPNAGWWAGRAHPAAGVVLLLTAGALVAEGDLSFGEPWLILALVGLIVAMAIGGALIGRTSDQLTRDVEAGGGTLTPELRPAAERLLLYSRLELAVLALVIFDMVAKPG